MTFSRPTQKKYQKPSSRDANARGTNTRDTNGRTGDARTVDGRATENRPSKRPILQGARRPTGQRYEKDPNTRYGKTGEAQGRDTRENRPPRAEKGYAKDFSEKRPTRPFDGEKKFERQGGYDNEKLPLVLGVKPVLELLESTPEQVDCVFFRKGRHKTDSDSIIDLCREHKVRFSLLDAEAFAKQWPGNNQGVVARVFSSGFADFETLLENIMDAPLPLLVVFDQVQDPGNAGTFARTLYAFGGAGLVIPKHNSVFLGGAAIKASAGALEKLPVARVGNLSQAIDAAKKQGITVYGTAALPKEKAQEIHEEEPLVKGKKGREETTHCSLYTCTPRLPALLVLGGEEAGMRDGVEKRCDILLGIPMLRPFDSFNVAQAGAMVLSWFVHKHLEKKS